MNENSIHPLTEERAAELWDAHAGGTVPWDDWYGGSRRALTSLLRAAFDAGQKYQDDLEDDTIRNIMQDVHRLRVERDAAIARAERAEDRLSDSVHVDEAARRVEAAREQGWDEAAQHIYNKGWEGVAALRKANPHRPAPELPTEDGAVIVPADGHDYIEARVYNKTYRAREAARHWTGGWHAAWRSGPEVRGVVAPEDITPGTWRTADDPR